MEITKWVSQIPPIQTFKRMPHACDTHSETYTIIDSHFYGHLVLIKIAQLKEERDLLIRRLT